MTRTGPMYNPNIAYFKRLATIMRAIGEKDLAVTYATHATLEELKPMGSSRDISDEVNAKQAEDKAQQFVAKRLIEMFRQYNGSSVSVDVDAVAREIVEYFNAGPGSGYVNQD